MVSIASKDSSRNAVSSIMEETEIKCILKGSDASIEIEACNSLRNAAMMNHDSCAKLFITDLSAKAGGKIDQFETMKYQKILYLAVDNGAYKTAKVLLRSGFRPSNACEYQGKKRNTPLHLAAHAVNEKMIKLLLSYGAEINGKDDAKQYPIHCVIKGANYSLYDARPDLKEEGLACLRLLLNNGADVNKQDFFGSTALHVAAINRNADYVHFLIKRYVL